MDHLMISNSPSTNVITVTNFKGGVAKTSIALNLAYELSQAGDKVLLIDLDPQGTLSHCLRTEDGSKTLKMASLENKRSIANVLEPEAIGLEPMSLADVVMQTVWENVIAAPANLSLQRVKDAILTNVFTLHFAIQESLEALGNPRWVIIDTHPDLDMKVTCAIVAAERILIPVRFDGAFYEGLRETIEAVGKTCRELHLPGKPCCVVPTMVDMRTGRDQAGISALNELVHEQQRFGDLFLRNTVKVGEASMRCMSVRELLGNQSRGAEIVHEYEMLADAVKAWF